ncbi:pilus assembly FimT family protein [Acinetobacter schindleri]|uniref:pilus assembly FimT family protein n=1 Tax=Acinetobacter schindleri TaxID=108981 RepID=UPI003F5636C0
MPFISNCVGFVKFIDIIFTEVKYCCLGDDMQKNKGFTLIELMVTIAVLAIIAMMAAPSVGTILNKQNLKKSSTDLMNTLAKARAKAALERREITVVIGEGADTPNRLHWSPSGKAILKSGNNLIFMPNGLVRDPLNANTVIANNTTFVICDTATNATASKTISISRMGTIQQPVDGACA